jgi:DNA-binding transcriptional LysR family regulator
MELRQLRAFTTIAETLSFRQAGKRLHVSQPSLSVQIKQLEEEVGVALFKRSKRDVQLTRAGEVFLVTAREVLLSLKNSAAAARHAETGNAGIIRLGFVHTASSTILPRLLDDIRNQLPLVTVELKEWNEAAQIRELESGTIDIGLGYLEEFSERLESAPLLREPFVIVLSKRHKAARKKEVGLSDLASDLLLLPCRDFFPSVHQMIANVFAKNKRQPNRCQIVEHVQTAVALAAAGAGFAFVPASTEALAPASVVFRPLREGVPDFETLVLWRRKSADALVLRVLQILAALQREFQGAGRHR